MNQDGTKWNIGGMGNRTGTPQGVPSFLIIHLYFLLILL